MTPFSSSRNSPNNIIASLYATTISPECAAARLADLDAEKVSRVLNGIGSDRAQTVGFLKEFRNAGDNVIFDGTDYLRILPGDVKDMTAFRATIREGGFTDVTAIIDKGFASNANANDMAAEVDIP